MKQTIGVVLASIVIAIAIAYSSYTAVQAYQKRTESEARYNCAQSSRYTVQIDEKTQVWYPIEDMYKQCLSALGL